MVEGSIHEWLDGGEGTVGWTEHSTRSSALSYLALETGRRRNGGGGISTVPKPSPNEAEYRRRQEETRHRIDRLQKVRQWEKERAARRRGRNHHHGLQLTTPFHSSSTTRPATEIRTLLDQIDDGLVENGYVAAKDYEARPRPDQEEVRHRRQLTAKVRFQKALTRVQQQEKEKAEEAKRLARAREEAKEKERQRAVKRALQQKENLTLLAQNIPQSQDRQKMPVQKTNTLYSKNSVPTSAKEKYANTYFHCHVETTSGESAAAAEAARLESEKQDELERRRRIKHEEAIRLAKARFAEACNLLKTDADKKTMDEELNHLERVQVLRKKASLRSRVETQRKTGRRIDPEPALREVKLEKEFEREFLAEVQASLSLSRPKESENKGPVYFYPLESKSHAKQPAIAQTDSFLEQQPEEQPEPSPQRTRSPLSLAGNFQTASEKASIFDEDSDAIASVHSSPRRQEIKLNDLFDFGSPPIHSKPSEFASSPLIQESPPSLQSSASTAASASPVRDSPSLRFARRVQNGGGSRSPSVSPHPQVSDREKNEQTISTAQISSRSPLLGNSPGHPRRSYGTLQFDLEPPREEVASVSNDFSSAEDESLARLLDRIRAEQQKVNQRMKELDSDMQNFTSKSSMIDPEMLIPAGSHSLPTEKDTNPLANRVHIIESSHRSRDHEAQSENTSSPPLSPSRYVEGRVRFHLEERNGASAPPVPSETHSPLQDVFQSRMKNFIMRSKQRVDTIANKVRPVSSPESRTNAKTFLTRRPESSTPESRLLRKTRDPAERKLTKKEMVEINLRSYSKLPEVQKMMLEKEKQELLKKNRENARKFEEKLKQNLKKKLNKK